MSTGISLSEGEKRRTLEEELKTHHELADTVYQSKANDKQASASNESNSMVTLTFDMQQRLPTPMLETSVAFCERTTSQYMIAKIRRHTATCGVRMYLEVASCVAKHLISLPSHVKHVILYSDTCGGQNKNSLMTAMCMSVIKNSTSLETIEHKFLLAGHTHMESDTDHSLIGNSN